MRVFFDTEFTGLRQKTTLVSIGCVADDGRTFYAEATDFNANQVDDWLRENVLANLLFATCPPFGPKPAFDHYQMRGDCAQIAYQLGPWLSQWTQVEMWADCLAYDWMLLCELFGGARSLPSAVYYIPFDLSTLLLACGLDPDVSREEFAGLTDSADKLKHNALWDARVIRACYNKCMAAPHAY